MFLHLMTDEKFMDGAITRFNRSDPAGHTFLVVHKGNFEGFRYIKQTEAVQVVFAGSEKYNEYVAKLPSYEAVFVHGLFSPSIMDMVNVASVDTVFIWLFWGGELWSFKHIRHQTMLPATRRLCRQNELKQWLRINTEKYTSLLKQGKFTCILRNFTRKVNFQNRSEITDVSVTLEKAIRRMNYVIPVVRNDFYVLEKHFHLKAGVLDWNYSIGISLDSLEEKTAGGNNILVGNSAHYSNNHLEIFKAIRKIKRWNGNVVVPLSYGDPVYKDSIIGAGKKMFGQRFMPLDTFLPAEQYFTLLESCSCAFFNTTRQQALGNIIFLLYQGTKVFLREENPVYQYFKEKGVQLYSIQRDVSQRTEALFEPISKEVITQNRSILKNHYSEEALNIKTRKLLDILKRSDVH